MATSQRFTACTEQTGKHKVFVAEEKSKKFRIKNNSEVTIDKIKVDNCLITGVSIRCDYLFEVKTTPPKAIYLELKGRDIEHAVLQLKATLTHLNARHSTYIRYCYVICSFVPKSGPKVQSIQIDFKKNFNSTFLVRENTHEIAV